MKILTLSLFLFSASFAIASVDIGADRKAQSHHPLSKCSIAM